VVGSGLMAAGMMFVWAAGTPGGWFMAVRTTAASDTVASQDRQGKFAAAAEAENSSFRPAKRYWLRRSPPLAGPRNDHRRLGGRSRRRSREGVSTKDA
jgi:hypothetical protein